MRQSRLKSSLAAYVADVDAARDEDGAPLVDFPANFEALVDGAEDEVPATNLNDPSADPRAGG
jgi:hypothetical protein